MIQMKSHRVNGCFYSLWTLSFLSQPRFNTRNLVVSHWGKEEAYNKTSVCRI